ncbi:hypothetical protein HHI_17056 [Hyphomonas hirschiana VP5]|uniref:Uncharacterized protein n=1 Tax=Hyphomonas hirschiana VP5 TaxID=1280951 RepID=A0A059F7N9_9PROT|nr:hypothetical protein HHI_17056 [Hyphomonas hirschiana VP5]
MGRILPGPGVIFLWRINQVTDQRHGLTAAMNWQELALRKGTASRRRRDPQLLRKASGMNRFRSILTGLLTLLPASGEMQTSFTSVRSEWRQKA